ncbi:MAG: YfhO family protein [Planctomycetes bacterium]|nr:YfhO family protein [Planctomycetota bacterium]
MRSTIVGLLLVLIAPAVLLAPSLFGPRSFVPFDVAQFAPISTMLTSEQLAEVTRCANNDPTEVVFTFIPELRFTRGEFEAGRLPHWNPGARFGMPLQATAVCGLSYPPNWLVVSGFEDPRDGLPFGAWLGFAIAGLLMFGFLRSCGLGVAACTFGALAFSMSGTLVAQSHFYMRMSSLVWTPGLLWGVRAVVHNRGRARLPAVAGLAICTAMTAVAGFPQYGAQGFLLAGIYGLFELHGNPRGFRRSAFVGLCVAMLFGLLLAAVQILPMTVYFPESGRRPVVTAAMQATVALDPAGWLAWFMPTLFGHPHLTSVLPYETSPLAYWLLSKTDWGRTVAVPTTWNFIEGTIFVGTLTIPLALFAMLRPKGVAARGLTVSLLTILALSGGYWWLGWFHTLPGLTAIAPARFAASFAAPVAALAAIGLDRLLAEPSTFRRRGLGVLVPLAGFAALVGWQIVRGWAPERFVQEIANATHARFADVLPSDFTATTIAGIIGGPGNRAGTVAHELAVHNLLRAGLVLVACGAWWALVKQARRSSSMRQTLAWIAVAGVAVELGAFAWPLTSGRSLPVSHDTPVHEFLRAERDRHASVGGFAVARATAVPATATPQLPLALPACALFPDRIRDFNGYTFMDANSHKMVGVIWGERFLYRGDAWPMALPDDARLQHPYLDLIGIRWFLSEDPLEHGGAPVGPQLRGTRLRPDGRPVQFWIYERPNALPRAFVVPRLARVADEAAVEQALADANLDPRHAAWVVAAEAAEVGSVATPDERARERSVTFVRDDVQRLELHVGDGPEGWLVLNDTWFSGWTARVDGEPVPMVRANLAMRGLRVPSGARTIEFSYESPRFRLGASISLLSLGVVFVFATMGWIARRRTVVEA